MTEVISYAQHRPLSSLARGVCEEKVGRIHAILNGLTPGQHRVLNLDDPSGDGMRYLDRW